MELYKMELCLCENCIEKAKPLFRKVDETEAKEGVDRCAIIFQADEGGFSKALFLPFEQADKLRELIKPLWQEAEVLTHDT